MAKIVPTTKSCDEICRMIIGNEGSRYYGKFVDTTCCHPPATHIFYGVNDDTDTVEFYKNKIKSIGGKHIRLLNIRDSKNRRAISFALPITPQEELEVKMAHEAKEREKQAYESKLTEIKLSPMLIAVGATNEKAQEQFARRLLNGYLDPLLPFESYVVFEPPRDKDEKRIIDIINKANAGFANCVGMCTTSNAGIKMRDLAERMNNAITDENKRARRRAACLHYGLKFLAECFK